MIVLYNQLELFRVKDHGFSMSDNIVIRLNDTPADALKTELLKYPNIKNAAAASHVPASGTTYGNGFKKSLEDREWTSVNYFVSDEDYLKNLDVALVAGEAFKAEAGKANSNSVIINEEAVRSFQYASPFDAIGEELIYQPDSSRKTIVGVLRYFSSRPVQVEKIQLRDDSVSRGVLQYKDSGFIILDPFQLLRRRGLIL